MKNLPKIQKAKRVIKRLKRLVDWIKAEHASRDNRMESEERDER